MGQTTRFVSYKLTAEGFGDWAGEAGSVMVREGGELVVDGLDDSFVSMADGSYPGSSTSV